ncbi:MAG: hypothetical protein CMF59_09080 [Leptospiraceae bacterium]|nr:hypothetical protein [Leptospiraceae bacterium]
MQHEPLDNHCFRCERQLDHNRAAKPHPWRIAGFLILMALPFLRCPASDIENVGNPLEEEFLTYNLLRCTDSHCDSENSSTTSSGPPVFYIYTVNSVVTGNLGPRATSTGACQTMQTTNFASLTCTNHLAVLSYSGDALDTAPGNHGVPTGRVLTSVSGVTVAPDWNTYLNGPLTNSLQAASVIGTTPTPFYWTGTLTGGGFDGTYNCSAHSVGTGAAFGSQGAITTTAATHIRFAVNQPCDGSTNSAYLMCVCWN